MRKNSSISDQRNSILFKRAVMHYILVSVATEKSILYRQPFIFKNHFKAQPFHYIFRILLLQKTNILQTEAELELQKMLNYIRIIICLSFEL